MHAFRERCAASISSVTPGKREANQNHGRERMPGPDLTIVTELGETSSNYPARRYDFLGSEPRVLGDETPLACGYDRFNCRINSAISASKRPTMRFSARFNTISLSS